MLRRFAMQASASPWPHRVSTALRICAVVYFASLWFETVVIRVPLSLMPGTTEFRIRILPRSLAYFTQVAALFPRAATFAIDYRAEGYVCRASEWSELDTRPYFPLDPDDKENRFQRVMYFFHNHRSTLKALEAYLVDRHNEGRNDDAIPSEDKIGGVRLMSIRAPLPEIGAPLVRVHRLPLSEIPEAERKRFYQTTSRVITERCFGTQPREEE